MLSNHPGAIHPNLHIVKYKTASAARNWINLSPKQKQGPEPFLLSSSYFYAASPPPSHSVWERGRRSQIAQFTRRHSSEGSTHPLISITVGYSWTNTTILCPSSSFYSIWYQPESLTVSNWVIEINMKCLERTKKLFYFINIEVGTLKCSYFCGNIFLEIM